MGVGRLTVLCLAALLLAACGPASPALPDVPAAETPPGAASPAPSPTASPSPPPPSPSPDAEPSPEPTPEPEPDYAALFTPYALPETEPDFHGIRYASEPAWDAGAISFGFPDTYTSLGITTLRGNNFRDNAAWGTVEVEEEKLEILYSFGIGYIDRWTGVGWNGQPSMVQWEPEVQALMNLKPEKKDKDGLVEVIYGTMDGKIYFFDLDDGAPTRDPINLGQPIKGSVTVDPRGYPILYVGQGVTYGNRFGFYIYSLIDGREIYFINGWDSFAPRRWGAFDSNPVFDTANDAMFLCGENGVVYSVKLNTDFNPETGELALDPEVSRYRYTNRRGRLGVESSPAAFSHYLFFGDNDGYVHCLDLKTLTPVWTRDVTDDTDASVVLCWDEEDKTLNLYTGCEIDHQAGNTCYLRKLNALNGDLLWEYTYTCLYDEAVNGGLIATPVSGRGDIAEHVIFFVSKLTSGYGGGGALVCFDKKTGDVVWENIMPFYGYSSPVALYTEEGKSYLVVSDSAGFMYLIRGTTGEILDRISVGSNVEGSAAAFGSKLVVGTRGMRIYGVELK
ncbi:MAG: PQQ-binding-like beta-propeller repeat protein [Oscillospiraceae bacterium]|nr:PQQ-binding-like beta-propeller repeat protein [Oscillospiraceae bacterium]